ncbi:mCG1047327, partial [Mus musculus]
GQPEVEHGSLGSMPLRHSSPFSLWFSSYMATACTSLSLLSLSNPTVRKTEMPSGHLRQGSLEQEGRHPTQRSDQHPSNGVNDSSV